MLTSVQGLWLPHKRSYKDGPKAYPDDLVLEKFKQNYKVNA